MQKLRRIDWSLSVGLGCLALIHPLMHSSGLMTLLGRPFGPRLVTVLISLIWVAIIVLCRVREPLATLTLTGLVAGLAVVIANTLLVPTVTGAPGGPLTHPIGIVATLATNTLWGALSGLLAEAIQRALRSSNQQEDRR